jgi:predicted nicotinamide N-methyase
MTREPTAINLPRRHRLRRRIESRYRLVTQTVYIGSLSFPFTRIADPDRVLDEVAAEEDRLEKLTGRRIDGDYLHLPYWAELWDSAAGVGAFIADGDLVASNVLDLGCGMGLCGTVAAARGATRVLFADLEPPALLLARLNSLPWSARVRTRRLDWRSDRLNEHFDLILGADILYERKQWEHLERFWHHHLAPGGMVVLGEPGRPMGEAFPQWITERGWTLHVHDQPVPTREKPIRLFLLTHNV